MIQPDNLFHFKFESLNMMLEESLNEIDVNAEYIFYNIMFLKEEFQSIVKVLGALRNLNEMNQPSAESDNQLGQLGSSFVTEEFECMTKEIPDAINDCLNGVKKLMAISAAIRGLAAGKEDIRSFININEVITNLMLALKQRLGFQTQLEMNLDKDIFPFLGVKSDIYYAFSKILMSHIRPLQALSQRRPNLEGKRFLSIRTKAGDGYNEVKICTQLGDPDLKNNLEISEKEENDIYFLEWIIISEHGGELEVHKEPHRLYESIIRLPSF